MTHPDLVAKKLVEIETFIAQLREHGRPDAIGQDLVQERFIEHTLQIAIQAVLDIASHVVSDDKLGEPRTNRELFDLLRNHGWISEELCRTLHQVVGFRNIVVHGYGVVDPEIVRDVAENHAGDLLEFVAEIRAHLES